MNTCFVFIHPVDEMGTRTNKQWHSEDF